MTLGGDRNSRHARTSGSEITLWRLEEKLDKEVRKLKERRALWAKRQEIAVARFLQGAFRAGRLEEKYSKRGTTRPPKRPPRGTWTASTKRTRKKRVYQNAISEYYRQRKEEYLQSTLMEGFDAAQQAKILRFRRRKEHEAELEKEERAKKLQEMLDDERIAGWIQKWERVKIERVAALRKHL